ncbi:hypothetical protein I313_06512 [Cryptococcus deuterogattii Ram5]|uniref:Unplaced genomic scaffold supercont1.19, whole genome shotgun sequence n=1 Tax=Cryptococcus deuterogattii Ram5 TaxID=1296110 RepID=A0A0D0SX70_9TREE|nr:hypothetical protein I313_06512 [Cryptococcus deuterogattii Ram5]
MTSQTGVFNIKGGQQKCFFFPVDREGNLLDGADAIFSGAKEEPFQLPALAKHLQEEKYERVFVLCHGWNNNPEATLRLYTRLISGLNEARKSVSASKDLYIGINWPSIVLAETWEQYVRRVTASERREAPRESSKDDIIDFEQLEKTQQVATFNELSEGLHISAETLGVYRKHTDRLKFATFDHRQDLARHDEGIEDGESSALSDSPSPDRIQTAEDYKKELETAFRVSAHIDPLSRMGGLDFLGILRGPTGRMMKKRAASIGCQSHAIRELLAELLESGLPVNLLGHSYGCKLLLDSVRSLFDPAKGVDRIKGMQFNSLILCQPAISRWVFSPVRGLYRPLLEERRFKKPVVTLYSDYDAALRFLYPLGYFYSPNEQQLSIRGIREWLTAIIPDALKSEIDIKMRPLLTANIPAAALGCHGPVKEGDETYIEVLRVKPSGEPYDFANMEQRCIGVKGSWTHFLEVRDGARVQGWGQECVFWLWHELVDR